MCAMIEKLRMRAVSGIAVIYWRRADSATDATRLFGQPAAVTLGWDEARSRTTASRSFVLDALRPGPDDPPRPARLRLRAGAQLRRRRAPRDGTDQRVPLLPSRCRQARPPG